MRASRVRRVSVGHSRPLRPGSAAAVASAHDLVHLWEGVVPYAGRATFPPERAQSVAHDSPDPGEITRILNEHEGDHYEALAILTPLVYEDLASIARRQLRNEAQGHTLQTIDLVHEAFLKLVRSKEVSFSGRAHFFAVSARVMRQILIDWAKRRRTDKRGGHLRRVPLDEDLDGARPLLSDRSIADLVALDRALDRLEALSERQARVVECRFFAGMGVPETAEALGVSVATVKRDWSVARAWLNHALSDGAGDGGG